MTTQDIFKTKRESKTNVPVVLLLDLSHSESIKEYHICNDRTVVSFHRINTHMSQSRCM